MASKVGSISNINELLEKTSDWDKDERYMATNDLCNLLNKDVKMDENMEQRICAAVLKQLDDQSNDVQSVAVKCLGIIIKKVQKAQIGNICTKLCSLILEGKDALRDVYSIGLKTLIADVPDTMGSFVCDNITVKLLRGITSSGSEEIQRECLDNMADLLGRFGQFNTERHHDIMTGIVQQLQNDRQVIRKRAANCLGSLAVVSSDSLLNELVNQVLGKIEDGTSQQSTQTLIQSIGTISRTVGYRLGCHLPRIVPLFIRFCGDPEDEDLHTDAANELRENCFPGLESFVVRCPKEVAPFLKEILEVAMAFMQYDPNYSYDEDEGMDIDNDDEEIDEEYEEDDYIGSDDDDTSWKVRKAAVKVITAIISSRPDMHPQLFQICGLNLLKRFKEREENVRLDIIKCFSCFLQSSSGHAKNHLCDNGSEITQVESNEVTRSPILSQLNGTVETIVAACCSQLAGGINATKSKSATLNLLRLLTVVLNGGLELHLAKLMILTEKCMVDRNQALKLDALCFLRTALSLHCSSSNMNLNNLLSQVVAAIQEDWYKIIAEALRTLSVMIIVIRPISNQTTLTVDQQSSLLRKIYNALLPKLEALDTDQEIKECAITAAGELFSFGADLLTEQLPNILQIFHNRMANETTRSPTLKALTAIAQSSLSINLSDFVMMFSTDISMFFRQSSRLLKQQALQAVDAIILNQSTSITNEVATTILSELATLITDGDLHLTYLGLTLIHNMLQKNCTATSGALQSHIYPRLLLLAKSSMLQGQAQAALLSVFRSLATAGMPNMKSADMFNTLYNTSVPEDSALKVLTSASYSASTGSRDTLSKAALSNLSKCVASILTINNSNTDSIVVQFTKDLQHSAQSSEAQKQLALLCLGEVGHNCDLSGIKDIQTIVLSCFESSSEDTKHSAAYALGHIAVGNLSVFLPVILNSTATNNRQQYLLLTALKELIVVFANKGMDFGEYLPTVLPVLLEQCKAEEESIRNMVAECLGVLTSIRSDLTIPVLNQLLAENSATPIDNPATESEGSGSVTNLCRRMVANALRLALSRHCTPLSLTLLTEGMPQFLVLLSDSDLEVKRSALLMANTAVHHYPQTISSHISGSIVPVLVETLKIKLERVVDLGPFKHRVDDNMPLRKASLTCIGTILDNAPNRLGDPSVIVEVLPLLLADKDEIKLQTHQILGKLCSYCPSIVMGQLDNIVPPLSKTVFKKPANKGDPTSSGHSAPELDRAVDMIKSGIRSVLIMERVFSSDASQLSRKWIEFVEKLRQDEFTASMIHSIEHERSNLEF